MVTAVVLAGIGVPVLGVTGLVALVISEYRASRRRGRALAALWREAMAVERDLTAAVERITDEVTR